MITTLINNQLSSLNSMEQIRRIHRPTDVPESGLLTDLLWSDPDPHVESWDKNDRGICYIGEKNNISFTIG